MKGNAVIGVANARTGRMARLLGWAAASLLAVCLPSAWAQHSGASHPAPHMARPQAAPRFRQAPMPQSRGQYQQMRPQNRMPENGGERRQPGFSSNMPRGYNGGSGNAGSSPYSGQEFGGQRQPYTGNRPGYGQVPAAPQRPAYPGGAYSGQAYGSQRPEYVSPRATTPGHLEDWLNRHQNAPVRDQERMLRGDPAFNRQTPGDQQREIQQLHQLNQMPEAQRDRRLARNEMLERLSPQQRMNLNRSTHEWGALPPDRQTMMKRAFRDLRNVPPDQRDTVLNSARYQGMFSPEERGILSDFLRVEPYQSGR